MKSFFEQASLDSIAKKFGTPTYVYSLERLESNILKIKNAFKSYPTLSCYAVKANSNFTLLRKIFASGMGADVVSIGELEKSLLAGVHANKIVFSGVGKKKEELACAVKAGVLAILVESEDEIQTLRQLGLTSAPRVGIRINPNIDVKTNPHIATGLNSHKFGIPEAETQRLIQTYFTDGKLTLVGLSCHLGSQIFESNPYRVAAERLASIALSLTYEKFPLEFIDIGGGFGVPYSVEIAPPLETFATAIISAVRKTNLTLVIEPGRSVIGNAGALLSEVIAVKKSPNKTFCIVDAGMNDLIRPALYDAFHRVEVLNAGDNTPLQKVDVVGPVCETGDTLAKDRLLPPLKKGDLILILDSGAYGFSMSSQYNGRLRAAEVLVSDGEWRVIRKREKIEDLWALDYSNAE